MISRGEILIIRFPYQDGGAGKNRPVVVVQSDANNRRLQNTIVAMITGNAARAGIEVTQFLVDPNSVDGKSSGLRGASAVKCENLYTVRQIDIHRPIGRLTPTLIVKLDACLKAALELK